MRLYILLTLLAVLATASPLVAGEAPRGVRQGSSLEGGPRVRTSDPRVIAAIADGAARSSSFLDVINEVEGRDVIVYVEMQPLLRGKLSGSLTWVTKTRQFRYVRVALNPDLTGSRLVAALAHELQHVAEVGRAASVIDTASLSSFYRAVGIPMRWNGESWETDAARRMGETVRRELTGPTTVPVAESIYPAANDWGSPGTKRD
jgi:hypothetical protein